MSLITTSLNLLVPGRNGPRNMFLHHCQQSIQIERHRDDDWTSRIVRGAAQRFARCLTMERTYSCPSNVYVSMGKFLWQYNDRSPKLLFGQWANAVVRSINQGSFFYFHSGTFKCRVQNKAPHSTLFARSIAKTIVNVRECNRIGDLSINSKYSLEEATTKAE